MRSHPFSVESVQVDFREKVQLAVDTPLEVFGEQFQCTVFVDAIDLTASEISVRLGATWLPQEVIQQFMCEFLDTPRYAQWNIKVHFSPYTGEWNIEGKSRCV